MSFLLADPETRLHRGFTYSNSLYSRLTFGFLSEIAIEEGSDVLIKFCLYLATLQNSVVINSTVRSKINIESFVRNRITVNVRNAHPYCK